MSSNLTNLWEESNRLIRTSVLMSRSHCSQILRYPSALDLSPDLVVSNAISLTFIRLFCLYLFRLSFTAAHMPLYGRMDDASFARFLAPSRIASSACAPYRHHHHHHHRLLRHFYSRSYRNGRIIIIIKLCVVVKTRNRRNNEDEVFYCLFDRVATSRPVIFQ